MIVRQLNGDIVDDFVEDSSGRLVPRKVSSSSSYSSSFRRLFHEAFLPQGFPDSVSDDYVPYQLWDTLQAFCSSITGALAMKAVLSGYGVGDETGSALAAAMTWLVKDGASMVGRIAFAWHLGAALDGDAKQWRLFADVLNDCAIFLELVSQFFPRNWFTPTICFAGVAKAVVGVAGGATRAALTQHQAKCNNMADVSAKDGSQETLTNLAALVVNLWLLPLVEERHALVWTLFLLFTILHIYSNYKISEIWGKEEEATAD